jgi:hypothetical protein
MHLHMPLHAVRFHGRYWTVSSYPVVLLFQVSNCPLPINQCHAKLEGAGSF